jgi:hypothetical protein
MPKSDEKIQVDFPVIHDSLKTLSSYMEQCQQEIPVIHECAETAKMLKSSLPVEFPVIPRKAQSLPSAGKVQLFLFNQVQAEIQYHLECAAAEKKLASELQKCSRLLVPPASLKHPKGK